MEKKKAAEATQKKTLNRNDTSASNARAIIIQALRDGPKTTIQLREDWGVMSPAPRIFELKALGHIIVANAVDARTADGVLHRGVAQYVLLEQRCEAMGDSMPPAANDSPCVAASA
jgi:Helix-turn-helix domain